jgi:hypothetical protein
MIDDMLRDSILDDAEIFDNTFNGRVIHQVKENVRLDFTDNTAVTSTVEKDSVNCLLRGRSRRQNTSIKQIHQRDASVQDDAFDSADLIVEVPTADFEFTINEGDTFIDLDRENKYNIIAVDLVTLETRYRIALRKLF